MATSAALLREARTRAGLSRRALAARAGTPTSTVSRIEAEQHDPTLPMLQRLLAAAGGELVVEVRFGDEQPTIAELATAVDQESGRLKIDWTRLRGFADWADRHTDELADAIASPPARTGTPIDAILAGFAEELAARHRLERPRLDTRCRAAPRDVVAAGDAPDARCGCYVDTRAVPETQYFAGRNRIVPFDCVIGDVTRAARRSKRTRSALQRTRRRT